MSTRVIPVGSTNSSFRQVTPLDGSPYIFVFYWNERSNHWFLTIRDSSGTDLVTGRKVVSNVPFDPYNTRAAYPPGNIWVIDLGVTEEDPRLRDLGDRVVLMYVDEANVV